MKKVSFYFGSSGMGIGLFSALLASLCCITPVVSLLAGISGIAAIFSWIEPYRPYLVVMTIGILSFAWYRQLKPSTDHQNCECDVPKKSVWHSKRFLSIISILSILLLSFPSYSSLFYKGETDSTISMSETNEYIIGQMIIKGMTCAGCEHHVEHSLLKHSAVIDASASYRTGEAKFRFDQSQVSLSELSSLVHKETGYEVLRTKIIP